MCRDFYRFSPYIPRNNNWLLVDWENDDWANIDSVYDFVNDDNWADGWNLMLHTPNEDETQPQPRENIVNSVENLNETFYACNRCLCPVVPMHMAVFDENIGLICGITDVKYGTIFNLLDIQRHYERQVECFGCHENLTFLYNAPDDVKNFQSARDVIIFDLKNIVSGVKIEMYRETLESLDEMIARDSRISNVVYDLSEEIPEDNEILISVNTVHIETIYDISSDEEWE